MKSHRMRLFIAAVALLLVGAVAIAQTVRKATYRHGSGMFGEHTLVLFAHSLDLTDAQQN